MNDVIFKHYLQFLKEGKEICFKGVDNSILKFYVREDGTLISKDEHGLYTETGLSGIEYCYVISGLDEGDYIETEDSGNPSKAVNPDLSRVESFIERAQIIVKQLKGLGYALEDVYKLYNESNDVMKSIDGLSPEFFLSLKEYKKPINYVQPFNMITTESEKKITANLFDSGKIVISDKNGTTREYYIDGGKLFCIDSTGEQYIDFIASVILRDDIDKALAGDVLVGNVLTDIDFKDEMAEKKAIYGMDTARLFSIRLGYTKEKFIEEYTNNKEFKTLVDRSNTYLWKATNRDSMININDFLKDATSRVSKRDVVKYERFVNVTQKPKLTVEASLEKKDEFDEENYMNKPRVENIYKKACTEVYEILMYFPADEFVKIPQEEIVKIDRNRDLTHTYSYKLGTRLEEQETEYETKVILTYLFCKYFLNDSQKIKVEKILEYNDRLTQNDMQNETVTNNSINGSELESRMRVEQISEIAISDNKNVFQRIIDKIRSLFK